MEKPDVQSGGQLHPGMVTAKNMDIPFYHIIHAFCFCRSSYVRSKQIKPLPKLINCFSRKVLMVVRVIDAEDI